MDNTSKGTGRATTLQRGLRRTILRNKHTLFFTSIALVLCVVAVEGKLTDREGRGAQFENPFFDLVVSPAIRADIRTGC